MPSLPNTEVMAPCHASSFDMLTMELLYLPVLPRRRREETASAAPEMIEGKGHQLAAATVAVSASIASNAAPSFCMASSISASVTINGGIRRSTLSPAPIASIW